ARTRRASRVSLKPRVDEARGDRAGLGRAARTGAGARPPAPYRPLPIAHRALADARPLRRRPSPPLPCCAMPCRAVPCRAVPCCAESCQYFPKTMQQEQTAAAAAEAAGPSLVCAGAAGRAVSRHDKRDAGRCAIVRARNNVDPPPARQMAVALSYRGSSLPCQPWLRPAVKGARTVVFIIQTKARAAIPEYNFHLLSSSRQIDSRKNHIFAIFAW
ncbi:Protein of unknown function, partial [Gryllus bimaculatus]